MKACMVVVAAAVFVGCARNPDPEYAPETDAAPPAVAAEASVAPAPAAAEAEAPLGSAVPRERALELGREAIELMRSGESASLWDRFDAQMKAALGTPEAFAGLMTAMDDQLGPEVQLIDETVGVPEEAPALTYYRRRSRYVLLSQTSLDLYVVFNPDETIAGITGRPTEAE